MPTVRMSLFSPRWGHEDEYEIRMLEDRLEFGEGPRLATCRRQEGSDPVWDRGQSVDGILTNDSIYAPAVSRSFSYGLGSTGATIS
jgi:hypothetical protein